MPYNKNNDLPKTVKYKLLTTRAQDIYRSAFNSAWGQYKLPKKTAIIYRNH
jgi:cation transport regulator